MNYTYPECISNNCVDKNNKAILDATYTFSDGRCGKIKDVCTKTDCLDMVNDGSPMDTDIFDSCYSGVDTRKISLSIQYIKINRHRGIWPVTISHIKIFDKDNVKINPVNITVDPCESNKCGNAILYNNDEYGITKNTESAYILIDLGDDFVVNRIEIYSSPVPYANYILGNKMELADNMLNIVYSYVFSIVKKVYVFDTLIGKITGEKISIPTFSFPSCVNNGCVDPDNNLLINNKYTYDEKIVNDVDLLMHRDTRCFRTKSTDVNSDILFKIQNDEVEVPSYLTSCVNSMNTVIKHIPINVITIEKTINSNIILSKIDCFNESTKIKIKTILTSPNIDNTYLLDDNYYTFFNTGSSDVENTYIQMFMPEVNTLVTDVHISIPDMYLTTLLNVTLFCINGNLRIEHDVTFTTLNINTLPYVYNVPDIRTYILKINGKGDHLTKYKPVIEVFDYPDCVNCIVDGKLLKNRIYKLSNDRCVFAKKNINVEDMNRYDKYQLSYSEITQYFNSCKELVDTRISKVDGRYIRLQNSVNGRFNLKEIVVKKYGNIVPISSSSSFPILYNRYAKYAYDISDPSMFASVDVSKTKTYPYMMFDLGVTTTITELILIGDESLIGVNIYIIGNDATTLYQNTISSLDYGSRFIDKIVLKKETAPLPRFDLSTIYTYPACIPEGCVINNGLIVDSKYMFRDGICKIPKINDPTCLTRVEDIYGADMDRCYKSCDDAIDTRYGPAVARIIRLESIDSAMITLTEFVALNTDSTEIPTAYAYAKGSSVNSQLLISKTQPVSSNKYIQIDLGADVNIAYVKLRGSNVIGNLFVVVSSGHLICRVNNINKEGTYRVYTNLDGSTKLNLIEEVRYPSCKTGDCTTIDNKPKPFFKYIMDDERCAIFTNQCDNDCLNLLMNNQLVKAEAGKYFKSCSSDFDTRFPVIAGRYIRLQSNNHFKIRYIAVFDKLNNKLPVQDTMAYPLENPNFNSQNVLSDDATYVSVMNKMDEIIPFVQLDLGSDVTMSYIMIFPVVEANNMQGCTLFIINNRENTIFEQDMSSEVGNKISAILLPGSKTSVSLRNIYQYPECKARGCITNNHQIVNQMYMIETKCYKAINNNPITQCLDNAVNLYGSSMNNCFESCSAARDTRYISAMGRYVKLSRTTPFTIIEFTVYDEGNNIIPIYSTYGDTAASKFTEDINTGVAITLNSFIIFDLQRDYTIDHVILSVPIEYTFNDLAGCLIQIISNDSFIIYQNTINRSTNSTELIKINKNQPGTTKLNMFNTVSYPGCNDCETKLHFSKPNMIYNLSNNRCVKSLAKCTIPNCMQKLNENTLNKTQMDTNFSNCEGSMQKYPPVSGRYVRIENATSNITLTSIIIYGIGDNILQPNDVIRLRNRVIQADINTDQVIVKVRLVGTFYSDSKIYVIRNNGNVVFQDVIAGNDVLIYTNDIYDSIFDRINIEESFSYPDCVSIGCLTDSVRQIDRQNYNLSDNRCLKAIGNKTKQQCLDKSSALSVIDMNNCFASCSSSVDTRYQRLTGRFVRIWNAESTNELNIVELKALNDQMNPLSIVSKHLKPFVRYANRSDVLNTDPTKYATTSGRDGYIQIDLGADINIDYIYVNATVNLSTLTNVKVVICNALGEVKYLSNITDLPNVGQKSSTFRVVNNYLDSLNIQIKETYLYPACKTTFNGGLTDTYRVKPMMEYTLDNGLSVIAKIACDKDDCLLDVYNNTLTLEGMNRYFSSTSTTVDSRFPKPVGRFIKIEKRGAFTINSLTVYGPIKDDSHILSFTEFAYPRTKPLLRDDPTIEVDNNPDGVSFVLLDLNQNVPVGFIFILSSMNTLIGADIYVITNEGKTVASASITTKSVSLYELLNIGGVTYPSVEISKTLSYPSCKSVGCTDDRFGRSYAYQKYMLDDNRCFQSSSVKLLTDCLDKTARVGDLIDSAMDTCFMSCATDKDTRYPAIVNGRWIRITKTGVNLDGTYIMKLTNIKIFKKNADLTFKQLRPVAGHIKPHVIGDGPDGDKIGMGNYLTGAITRVVNGFIQLDLGNDYQIDKIELTSSDNNTLNNTDVMIINTNKIIVYKKSIRTLITEVPVVLVPVNNQSNREVFDIKEICTHDMIMNPASTDDCVGTYQYTRPGFQYTTVDNRCGIAKNSGNYFDFTYFNPKDDLFTYTEEQILYEYDSCDPTYLTQFIPATGRYIRIERLSSSTKPIKIAEIEVYDTYKNKINTAASKTYGKPYKSYTKYMTDGDVSTVAETDIITDVGYLQIDLGRDYDISYIVFKNNTIDDANSVFNSKLIIIKENKEVDSFKYLLSSDGSLTNVITVSKHPMDPWDEPEIIDLSETINWPCVTGCYKENNTLYENFKYTLSDSRCFIPKHDGVDKSILISVANKELNPADYFASCDATTDTRYILPLGRYIKVYKNVPNSLIALTKLEAYDKLGTFIRPIDITIIPFVSSIDYRVLLNTGNIISVQSGTSNSPYIMTDLGRDMLIDHVVVDNNNVELLRNAILVILNTNNNIVFQKNIDIDIL